MRSFVQIIAAVMSVSITFQVMAKSPLPMPTVESHKAFLVGEWKPNSPTVVVFKDPFCPYCLKALEKKDELDNVNLFLFWYPIFGEKSDNRVSEFFRCASPVNRNVIEAVLQHSSPDCKGNSNSELEILNREMYEAYDPPGVPAFYLGGQKVSFVEVKSIQVKEKFGVNLEWERYSYNRVHNDTLTEKKAAVYLSESMPAKKVKKIAEALILNTDYQWYLFPSNAAQLSKQVCSILKLDCASSKSYLLQSSQEIALLYGLDSQDYSQVIIDGRLISQQHLSGNLQTLAFLMH